MTATKNIKIIFMYDHDEDGDYLNARIESPKGIHWLYDITTEEAIVEALKDVNVELETDYEWNESEEYYE